MIFQPDDYSLGSQLGAQDASRVPLVKRRASSTENTHTCSHWFQLVGHASKDIFTMWEEFGVPGKHTTTWGKGQTVVFVWS